MARGAASRGPRHDDLRGVDQANPGRKVRRAGREPDYTRDARGVRYPSRHAPRHTYLTTDDLAKELRVATKQVHRWCVKWFGPLPDGRAVRGQGYRIPLVYRYVARFWNEVTDEHDRILGMKALVADPRPWVVVAGELASTHWSKAEVVTRVDAVLHSSLATNARVTILNVGPIHEE